jgi:DUF971 family protein
MAGLDPTTQIPSEIKLHQKSCVLELVYPSGDRFELSCEFLRVFTPSAEARGHGPGQETLQVGKRGVRIEGIEPVGNYAIQPLFSDGHSTGIYSWDLLYNLAHHRDELWQTYLDKLAAAGAGRDASTEADKPRPGGGCGH